MNTPFRAAALVVAFAVLISISLSALPQCTAKQPHRLVEIRGFLASIIREGEASTLSKAADLAYVPGATVFLADSNKNPIGGFVSTDLSGRFTLRGVDAPGTYNVCWKALNFLAGCQTVTLVSDPVYIGTLRMMPQFDTKHSVLYGRVRFADGTAPREYEPFASVNAFARVSLIDGTGSTLQKVYVNNFGEYVLPNVLGTQKVTVRASIEGIASEQKINPWAALHATPFTYMDLTIANNRPHLDPILPFDSSGKRLLTAVPGQQIVLHSHAVDDDGDVLHYRWVLDAASGSVSDPNAPSVVWSLPDHPGRYAATLVVYDGKGGYAETTTAMRTDTNGVPFSGLVNATDSAFVAGATVEINGTRTLTQSNGRFLVFVNTAPRFVINVNADGYAPLSQISDRGLNGATLTLHRASVQTIDPSRNNLVVDRRDPRNCPGPQSSSLDWRTYAKIAQPQFQDGKGHIVPRPRGLKQYLPLPGYQAHKECGPGMQVAILANSLQDEHGNPPAGNIQFALSTVDLSSPMQMPGDYTVASGGTTQVMESYGAGTIEVTSGGHRYNLKPGAHARVLIPIDPSQLSTGFLLPTTIPVLSYDEKAGVWLPESTATRVGNAYVAFVSHFSAINSDTIKSDQSCVDVHSPTLPPAYNLEVTIPIPGAAPKVINRAIDNSSPSRHVIYNLPSNVNIVLVPIDNTSNVPIGVFVVNTGGPQNPSHPNLPVDYDSCSTHVTLSPQTVPDDPLPGEGEFLQGLYDFTATNLSELDSSNPGDATLLNELTTATQNYYRQIDPRNKRPTLAEFRKANNFGAGGEIEAFYANSGDLGIGRDMHCVHNGSDVACYVTNSGDIGTDDTLDANDAVAHADVVATVAMEFSCIEDAPPAPDGCSDPTRVTKFYVFNGTDAVGADGTSHLPSASLDTPRAGTQRFRPVPQLCMVCHGGEYPGGPIAGPTAVPLFNSRADVDLGSSFLPFDLHFYTSAAAPHDIASEQAIFQNLNQNVVSLATTSAIQDLITKWYSGGLPQDQNVVVDGWNAQPGDAAMYKNVIGRSCRTCHTANVFPSLRFDQESQLASRAGDAERRVCLQHVMPHAKVTHRIFWTSTGPSIVAQFQVWGDAFGAAGGWNGKLCGIYTAGGPTPVSTFAATIQPIFDGNCIGCHGVSGGLTLTSAVSYANLVNHPSIEVPTVNRIAPNDPLHSYLFLKINGTQASVKGSGSQMPLGGPPLSASDITTIQNWINSGAPGP